MRHRFVRPARAALAALLLLLASPAPAPAEAPEEGLAHQPPFFLFYATHPRKGTDVYRSDGTTAGTSLLFDTARPGEGNGAVVSMAGLGRGSLAVVESSADRSRTRPGLYAVARRGAPQRILDRNLRNALRVTPLQTLGGRLLFAVVTNAGSFLYESDGTAEGTRALAPLRSLPIGIVELAGGRTLSLTNDATGDARGTSGRGYLLNRQTGALEPLFDFASDGGENFADRRGNGEQADPLVALGRRAVFWRWTPRHGIEPWATDGTSAGTGLLANIGRGSENGSGGYWGFLPLGNGKALFLAVTEREGEELWVTDGTPGGTLLLRDILPGPRSSEVRLDQMVVLDGKAYFLALRSPRDQGLWVTDGTPAGTRRVPLRHEGAVVQAVSGGPRALAVVDGLLYFEGRKASSGCARGGDRECRYDIAVFSYAPASKRLRLRAQTTEFACRFINNGVETTYAGGSYSGFAAFDKRLFFSASGQRKREPMPACGSVPFDAEPWLLRGSRAAEVAQINPGQQGSRPVFIGWSGCDGRC